MTFSSPIRERIALVVVAGTLALLPFKHVRGQDAGPLLRRALEAERSFQYSLADSLLSEVVYSLSRASAVDARLLDAQLRLAKVRVESCRFDDARSAYADALLNAVTTYGISNVYAAACLNGLGNIEYIQGRFGMADRLCRKALKMAERTGGTNHLEVATACRQLAFTYRALGLHEYGKKYAQRAVDIGRMHLEAPPEDLIASYVALGYVQRAHGGYVLAEASFLQAHALALRAYNDSHPICALVYHHQAGLAVNLLRGDEGYLNSGRALEIIERTLGADHLQAGYARWYRARAFIYMGRFREALAEAERADDILRSQVGAEHRDLAYVTGVKALCYEHLGLLDSAMVVSRESSSTIIKNYITNCAHLDPQSAAFATLIAFDSYSGFAGLYFSAPNPTREQSELLAENVINSKGLTSEIAYARAAAMRNCTDPRAQGLLAKLEKIRSERAELFFSSTSSSIVDHAETLDSLRSEEQDVLADLTEFNSHDANREDQGGELLRRICEQIPDDACVVDFYYFRHVPAVIPPEPYREIGRYAAVIYDRDGVRAHVDLGIRNNLTDRIPSYDSLNLSRSAGRPSSEQEKLIFDSLNYLILSKHWTPLRDHIRDGELVLVCPDMTLGKIPIGALYDESGRYLIERNPFHYLTSARDLLRLESPDHAGTGLFTLGDPDFDAPAEARLASLEGMHDDVPVSSEPIYAMRSTTTFCDEFNRLELARLPNSRNEIELVNSRWSSDRTDPRVTFVGPAANEEAIKRFLPGRRVAHIATHGFYIRNECRPAERDWREVANPLLYSGLLLAGANLIGDERPSAEDGVLTGDEVSCLDLSGLDLLVLSACESGLGRDFPGQGATGVARAFQIAGAKQVVSTLWPVSDYASVEMMSAVYESDNRPIFARLRSKALQLIEDDRKRGITPDATTWAPFITSGDWRAR